ncbi:hypothetical protein, partial [Novosphingobium sp. BW1]|uniref:hypothetical protein n=1 Tax=Novosphingobium sp. BW1 TaxID=2592621 RepID=UPI0011DE7A8C
VEPLGVRSCNLNLDARSHAPSSHVPPFKGIPKTESSVPINPLELSGSLSLFAPGAFIHQTGPSRTITMSGLEANFRF